VTGAPVLLVDDHGLFAQSVQIGLHAAGVSARRVHPGSAAAILGECASAAPATVLLDLRLGTGDDGVPIDGLDLVAPVVAAGCQVVVVTAETGDDI
jgi:DNA-binding NarL/FixJ family response regulator